MRLWNEAISNAHKITIEFEKWHYGNQHLFSVDFIHIYKIIIMKKSKWKWRIEKPTPTTPIFLEWQWLFGVLTTTGFNSNPTKANIRWNVNCVCGVQFKSTSANAFTHRAFLVPMCGIVGFWFFFHAPVIDLIRRTHEWLIAHFIMCVCEIPTFHERATVRFIAWLRRNITFNFRYILINIRG